jgi:nucleoside-diphosphate-sugar epimerase
MRYDQRPWRPGDQKVFVANNAKARRDFGFAPAVRKEEGLERMLEWVRGS